MKIYIMTDYEGVAGIVDWENRKDESIPNILRRQRGWRLLTGEVNAAVDGCFRAGATEVVVDDSHGGAYTIDYENLDRRAKVLHGRSRPRIMAGLDGSFDAMMMIGAHAMARTQGGVLYHTMSLDTREIRINGKAIGEFGIFAFVAGAFGVPTIMISGDAAACAEGRKLIPGLVAVPVKEGLSRYAAISLSKEEARERITEGVVRAVRNIKKTRPYKLKAPFTYQEDDYIKTGDDGYMKTGEGLAVSHPDALPKKWKTSPVVKADTAQELIAKVWTYKV